MNSIAYAMGQAPAGQQSGSALAGFLPIIIILLVFYFILIRPQKKQMQQHQQMLNALKKGDMIITSGGIHGKITALKGKQVEVEVAPGTRILINKQAVSKVMGQENEEENK